MGVLVLAGNVGLLRPTRTFTDGQLFDEVTVVDDSGRQQEISKLFCPNRLLDMLLSPGPKQIYVWKLHVFAIGQNERLTEDVKGVTRSYLTRDLPALGLMMATIVLSPYAAWVGIKKLYGLRSISEMRNALDNA